MIACKKTRFVCIDGPLAGQHLWLHTDGKTLVFKLGAWVGRYVTAGFNTVHWEGAQ